MVLLVVLAPDLAVPVSQAMQGHEAPRFAGHRHNIFEFYQRFITRDRSVSEAVVASVLAHHCLRPWSPRGCFK